MNPIDTLAEDAPRKSLAGRYDTLVKDRFMFIQRAREAALYTIPMLFPPEGHTGSTRYYTPFQALGARGVNNLSSKLLLALFPPEQSFFRFEMDPKLAQQLDDDQKDQFDAALSIIEQYVGDELVERGVRIHLFEAIKQLIVGGNVLVHLPDKGGIRVFNLANYVVKRDPSGNVMEIVTKEVVSPSALPESVRDQVEAKLRSEPAAGHHDKTVELYTCVYREDDQWSVCQEVKGFDIPESEGHYPLDKCPWIALRWSRIDAEDYGRGLCEEYIGDLVALEGLSKALLEGAAICAKVLFLVKPGGTTRPEVLNDKPNGSIQEGDMEDCGVLQVEKMPEFQFVSNLLQGIEQRLSFAFLLQSAIQRQGERVTAEEIRYMAGELEDALGGVYSLLSEDLQLPLCKLLISQMQKVGELPKLPKDSVTPTIITGMDALGRNHDVARLTQFIQTATQALGPEIVQQYLNAGDFLTRLSAAMGIDSKGMVKPTQQVQAEQQQQQQAQMAQTVAPHVVKGVSDLAKARMQNQAQGQPQENGTSVQ